MNSPLPRVIAIDGMSAPSMETPAAPSGFGLADLFASIISQRLLVLAVIFAVLVAGVLHSRNQVPTYFSQAQVALGGGQSANVSKGPSSGPDATPDGSLVQSELEVLRSNDLMLRLIKASGPEVIAAKLGLADPASYAGVGLESGKARDLVQALRIRLQVQRQQTSNVIGVGFTSASPQGAAFLANALIDVYLDSKVDERLAASQRASDWLNRRVEQLAKEVETKEAAVAAYRADMKLLSVGGATLNEQQYFKAQGEVVAARADLAGKQARLDQIQQIAASGGTGEAVLEAVSSPTIQALRQREAEVAGREAELKQRYFPTHPSVLQAANEHTEVLRQISAEVDRIKSSQSNEVDVARSRLKELEAGLGQLEGSLVAGNRAFVQLKELERDAEASSSVYRDFMQRAREIAEQETLKVVDARPVSRAIQPDRPSSTDPKLWIAFFFAGGLFFALVGGITRSVLNDRIVRPEIVARRVGTPALVSVPLISQRQLRKLPPDERTPEDYLVNKPMTAFAEALRVLGASLIADHDGGSGLSVAITSAFASEGKTTVSLSLGRAAAMSGLRVLIIDCDARRPSISASIGEKPAVSLADVMRNTASWRDAAVLDPLTSALVLPINAKAGDLQSLFRPEAVRKLLNEVRADFDLIVMDCPPVLAVAETRWLTMTADATIVVAHWNRTRASAVRTAAREVLRSKGRLSGVVLNRIDVAMTRRFSFSDSLYYGDAGKNYYTS